MPVIVVSRRDWPLDNSSSTYACAIWRLSRILIIVSNLVKVIFVQLSDETRKVAVFEVLGQDVLGKLFVLL